METKVNPLDRKIRREWVFMIAGVILLLIGFGIKFWMPALYINLRPVFALGLLVAGIAGGGLVRDTMLRKDPKAAREARIAEKDERIQAIRFRAGNKTFELTLLVSIIGLMVYSFLSRGVPGPDYMWFYLAFLVVGQGIAYVAAWVYYQGKY